MSTYTSFGNIGIPGSSISATSAMIDQQMRASAQQDAADRAMERRIVDAAVDRVSGPSPVAVLATIGAGVFVLWLIMKNK